MNRAEMPLLSGSHQPWWPKRQYFQLACDICQGWDCLNPVLEPSRALEEVSIILFGSF